MVLFWTPSSSNHHASVPTTRRRAAGRRRAHRVSWECALPTPAAVPIGARSAHFPLIPILSQRIVGDKPYNQAVHTSLHKHCDCWTAVGARSTWVGRSMQASSDKCHPRATGVAQNTKSLMSWSRHSSVPTAFATTILKAPLLHGVPDRALDSLYPKNTTRMSMNMRYTGTLCAWKSSHQLIFWQALH